MGREEAWRPPPSRGAEAPPPGDPALDPAERACADPGLATRTWLRHGARCAFVRAAARGPRRRRAPRPRGLLRLGQSSAHRGVVPPRRLSARRCGCAREPQHGRDARARARRLPAGGRASGALSLEHAPEESPPSAGRANLARAQQPCGLSARRAPRGAGRWLRRDDDPLRRRCGVLGRRGLRAELPVPHPAGGRDRARRRVPRQSSQDARHAARSQPVPLRRARQRTAQRPAPRARSPARRAAQHRAPRSRQPEPKTDTRTSRAISSAGSRG